MQVNYTTIRGSSDITGIFKDLHNPGFLTRFCQVVGCSEKSVAVGYGLKASRFRKPT